jgi:hypothetical protein
MLDKENKKFLESLNEKNLIDLTTSLLEKIDALLFDNKQLSLIVTDQDNEEYIAYNNENNYLLSNRVHSTFSTKFYSFDELKDKFTELRIKGFI